MSSTEAERHYVRRLSAEEIALLDDDEIKAELTGAAQAIKALKGQLMVEYPDSPAQRRWRWRTQQALGHLRSDIVPYQMEWERRIAPRVEQKKERRRAHAIAMVDGSAKARKRNLFIQAAKELLDAETIAAIRRRAQELDAGKGTTP